MFIIFHFLCDFFFIIILQTNKKHTESLVEKREKERKAETRERERASKRKV